jgi:hypothetical protein
MAANAEMKEALSELLLDLLAPKTEKAPEGEPKYIIVVNGQVITARIKSDAELISALKAMAIEDARNQRTTDVVVYSLDGKATVAFDAEVTVDSQTEESQEEEA